MTGRRWAAVGVIAVILMVATTFATWRVRHYVDEAAVELTGPVRVLSLAVDAGTVEVVGTDGPAVRVIRTRSSRLAPGPASTERLADGRVRVVALCPGGIVVRCRTDYRIELPADATVQARVGSGKVIVRDMSGSVLVVARSADIELDQVTGTISVKTDGGSVDGRDLVARQLNVETRAGDVTLTLAEAAERVFVRGGAGKVDLTVPDVPYQVEADSQIGIVKVGVCRSDSAWEVIGVSATLGDVTVRRAGAPAGSESIPTGNEEATDPCA